MTDETTDVLENRISNDGPPDPLPPSPDERVQACTAEVTAVLRKYSCGVHPVLNVKAVGDVGNEALVTATFQVRPLSENS